MTSVGNLLDARYTDECVAMARNRRDFVMAFIALAPLNSVPDDDFVVMTSGCAVAISSSWARESAMPQTRPPRRSSIAGWHGRPIRLVKPIKSTLDIMLT